MRLVSLVIAILIWVVLSPVYAVRGILMIASGKPIPTGEHEK